MDEKCLSHMAKPVVKVESVMEEPIGTTSEKLFEDTEVDIVSWTNKGDASSNKNEDPDATEYSSSFADTDSDAGNSSRSSDAEAEAEFSGDDGMASPFDAHGPELRMRNKKKVTEHWRNYIRPLMWRCKWTEIKLKQLEDQAKKYKRELDHYDKKKHRAPDQLTLEEFGSKSLPFPSQRYRSKARERRIRKKVEDTTDIASYTSHHHLFSYLENKKSDADADLDDNFDNPVVTEPLVDSIDKFRLGENISFPELNNAADASYESLLKTIDKVQSTIQKLQGRANAVISKNASKFYSSENFSLLPHGDAQTSSAQSPTNSAGNGYTASVGVGGTYNSTQHGDEFDFGDFVLPDSAASSLGEAANIPDIIESTVGFLTDADVTLQPALVGDSGEHMVENVFMHEATHHPIQKLQDVKTEVDEGPYSIPVIKRKRGERKACSSSWSKKSSGEAENM